MKQFLRIKLSFFLTHFGFKLLTSSHFVVGVQVPKHLQFFTENYNLSILVVWISSIINQAILALVLFSKSKRDGSISVLTESAIMEFLLLGKPYKRKHRQVIKHLNVQNLGQETIMSLGAENDAQVLQQTKFLRVVSLCSLELWLKTKL